MIKVGPFIKHYFRHIISLQIFHYSLILKKSVMYLHILKLSEKISINGE